MFGKKLFWGSKNFGTNILGCNIFGFKFVGGANSIGNNRIRILWWIKSFRPDKRAFFEEEKLNYLNTLDSRDIISHQSIWKENSRYMLFLLYLFQVHSSDNFFDIHWKYLRKWITKIISAQIWWYKISKLIFADTFSTKLADFLKCQHLEGEANTSQLSVSTGRPCLWVLGNG